VVTGGRVEYIHGDEQTRVVGLVEHNRGGVLSDCSHGEWCVLYVYVGEGA
jgi:hypothetical protein